MNCVEELLASVSCGSIPKLFVFDLDYTLWPFWIDTHVTPPFEELKRGQVIDKFKMEMKLYPGTKEILMDLKKMNIKMAAASRTEAPNEANDFLKLIGIYNLFDYKEIYPGCKLAHFQNFHRHSGIDYDKMIFFDDERRNIEDISKLGVTCIYVRNGLNFDCIKQGLSDFSSRLI